MRKRYIYKPYKAIKKLNKKYEKNIHIDSFTPCSAIFHWM